MIRALRRLFRFATCRHMNACVDIDMGGTELSACTRCGQVLWIVTDNDKRHNRHLMRDRLAV